MTFTKNEIANHIAQELDISALKSTKIIETILELIKHSLESGEDVLISGFGKFIVKEKRERRGRNPATGEDLILTPRRILTFRCSGKLKERING